MELLYISLTIFPLYVLYTVFGMTLLPASLRSKEKQSFSFLMASLLGAAVWIVLSTSWLFSHNPWNLPIRLLAAAVWCGFRWKTLFLPKEKTPYMVFAVIFPISVCLSRLVYPFEINGELYFSFAVYDHVRCAIVNSIATFGIPPVNPWLADNGQPIPLFYYFGWYAWAAQLTMLTKVSALFAESCMTGFSALVVISGLTGIAGLSGLGKQKYGIAAFLFFLLFVVNSSLLVQGFFPEKVFQAINPTSFIVGYWSHIDNFLWSPHHMFSGALILMILFLYFQMFREKARGEKLWIAVLIGILSASASFTSIYAGAFTLVYVGISAMILYLAWGSFRRRINRNIAPHAIMLGVFAVLSISYFRYLTSVKSESFPLSFGIMSAYELHGDLLGWVRYLFSLYVFQLPNNIGLYFILGLTAWLIPRFLPKNGFMIFFRVFIPVSLLSITFIHSSFYSNDFGWRSFTTTTYMLSLFSAFLLVRFIAWFRAGRKVRIIFGYAIIVMLIGFECLLYKDAPPGFRLRKTYPELRGQFARSIKGWDVVHQYTKENDLVQCNPKSFYELGMLYEIEDVSTNFFFSLYSRRATAIGDMIFSKCYSEYYSQEKLQKRYDRVCAIFDGDPSESEIAYLAEDLKIKAVLTTPYDGIWEKPGAIRKYYPHLIETPDYRVYLPDAIPATLGNQDESPAAPGDSVKKVSAREHGKDEPDEAE